MTIPGRGDLSPRRRHAGYGRRRRRWPRVLLVLLVLAALVAGGYYGWQRWHDDSSAAVRTAPSPSRCPSVAPKVTPLPSAGLTIRVLNGSRNRGRATRVATQLHTRFGVVVANVGHGRRTVHGRSVVRYPRGKAGQARLVSGLVIPHARLVSSKAVPRVELDIGTRFHGLRHVGSHRQVGTATAPKPSAARPGCAGS